MNSSPPENTPVAQPLTAGDIASALKSILMSGQNALMALSEEDLGKTWRFTWNAERSIEWNIYEFSRALEHFKRQCRDWEEYHHGSACVVERVRDKYVMPVIKQFHHDFAQACQAAASR